MTQRQYANFARKLLLAMEVFQDISRCICEQLTYNTTMMDRIYHVHRLQVVPINYYTCQAMLTLPLGICVSITGLTPKRLL